MIDNETERVENQVVSVELDNSGESPEDNDLEQETSALNLVATISSLLFVSPKPLKLETISEIVGLSVDDLEAVMEEVRGLYSDEKHGFALQKVGGGFQLRTAPAALPVIKKLKPNRGRRLSRAAAETLAVIAYKQPVQRAEIENVRGVDALPTLKTLLDAKLIRIIGKEDSVGNPVLYGTTQEFLEIFGLSDLSELPSVQEMTNLANEQGEVLDDNQEEVVAEPSVDSKLEFDKVAND
ncbi:MAG: SMC-Scp complex subunit ScpB [Deltaproteobacteria bacterium]|jgi:segregation and condensation protein B|nr:SMC-Scp complex subunit ScpB [Deltaproteobacteria bacterium]